MANTFTVTTEDGLLTYSATYNPPTTAFEIDFEVENNIKRSNTQGFLIKVQKGRTRVRATLLIVDSATNMEGLEAIVNYPDEVNATFDRNIPLRQSTQGKFAITDFELKRELSEDGQVEMMLDLVEVLAQ